MNKKTVEAIIAPPPPHMVGDGFRVHNFFPNSRLIDKKRMSPFFLLDYNSKVEFTPSKIPRGTADLKRLRLPIMAGLHILTVPVTAE